MPQHGENTPVGELVLVGIKRQDLVPGMWEMERPGQIFPTIWRDRVGSMFIMYRGEKGIPDVQPYDTQHVHDYLQTTAGRWLGFFQAKANRRTDPSVEPLSFSDGETETQDQLNAWASQPTDGKARMHLDVITTVHNPLVMMLTDFVSADDLWGGYLLPSGKFVFGPHAMLLKVMRECIADGTLDDNPSAFYTTVSQLIDDCGEDVPREWRRKALHMFYKSMLHDNSDYWERNARSNAVSWAKNTFGLHPEDITALPWF